MGAAGVNPSWLVAIAAARKTVTVGPAEITTGAVPGVELMSPQNASDRTGIAMKEPARQRSWRTTGPRLYGHLASRFVQHAAPQPARWM